MGSILREIRFCFRRLRRVPALSSIVVLVLGLGIGATTTIFSVVDGVLLADLPYGHPDRLVMMLKDSPRGEFSAFAPAELLDFRRDVPAFEQVAGVGSMAVNLTGEGEPVRLMGASVSSNLFSTLGVRPFLGGGFGVAEDGTPDLTEAAISYGLWQSRFGGHGDILGQELQLDGKTHRVVAVLPRGFDFPEGSEIWLPGEKDIPRLPQPFPMDLETIRQISYFSVVARLAPEVPLERAQNDLQALRESLLEEFPDEYEGRRFRAVSLKEHLVGDAGQQLWVLQGAVLLVLLVACANVANLLLVRSVAQRRDRAIREALGASRKRLWGFALEESLMLGLGGGALGTVLAFGGVQALKTLAPEDLPRMADVAVDGRVLLFGLVASLLAGLLAGLLPALEGTKGQVAGAIKEGGLNEPASGRRLRSSLVSLEVALALLLLIGAGLMMKSLWALRTQDPGFQPAGVSLVQLNPPRARYASPEALSQFYRSLLDSLEGIPQVEAYGLGLGVPFSGAQIGMSYQIEGQEDSELDQVAALVAVSPGYFKTLGIALLSGRPFFPADLDASEPVAVISRSLAETHWPGENAVGRRITLGDPEEDGWSTIVGVVDDVRQGQLDADPHPTLYGLFTENTWPFMTAVLRTSLGPAAAREIMKAKIHALDPLLPVAEVQSMEESIGQTLAERRFLFVLLAGFAVLALALAGIGLYGLVAYSVARRRREIGIRMALGARREGVVAMILRQGLTLVAIGVVLGLTAAVGLTTVLGRFLYEVDPRDPPTFAVLTLFLAGVATLASYLPARRAAKVDPNRALRYD